MSCSALHTDTLLLALKPLKECWSFCGELCSMLWCMLAKEAKNADETFVCSDVRSREPDAYDPVCHGRRAFSSLSK